MPRAFSKMGDSLSLIAYYLVWFDQDRYDLGPYADLQPTIDLLRQVLPALWGSRAQWSARLGRISRGQRRSRRLLT